MSRAKVSFLAHSDAKAPLNLQPGLQTLGVSAIRLRENADSRSLNASHVVNLAETIDTLGLLEPLVIDETGQLLAGGHRLAALQILAIQDPEARKREFARRTGNSESALVTKGELFEFLKRIGDLEAKTSLTTAIPVQVVALDADNREKTALAIEAAENNVRRQYSRDEILALAERYRKAGYVDTKGRPKGGKKTVMSALEAALGRSKRQIQRILSDEESTREPKDPWEKAHKAFQKAAKNLVAVGELEQSDEAKALVEKVGTIIGNAA